MADDLHTTLTRLSEAANDLLKACHEDFGVPDDLDRDDEPVARSDDGGTAITFGHMRRLSAALASGRLAVVDGTGASAGGGADEWVMVPREPTKAMLEAGWRLLPVMEVVWAAMIAAAPVRSTAGAGGETGASPSGSGSRPDGPSRAVSVAGAASIPRATEI